MDYPSQSNYHDLKDNCSGMNQQCVSRGLGGTNTFGPFNGYTMLYRDGTNHFIPIGSSCRL